MTADEKYMAIALEEARTAAREGEVPVGAIVVSPRGVIIGRGHNLTERLGDVTAHAEMLALTAAAQSMGGKFLDECTIYVTVEPCLMCAGAIGWSRVGRVVIGAPDPKRGYTAFTVRSPFHPRAVVTDGVMQRECGALMSEFFAARRR